MVLVGALLEVLRQPDVAGAHVPQQDAEGVRVHAVVVLAGEELWRHMDGRAHDTATHHGLGLAETQISDLAAVVFVQLRERREFLS